MSAITSERKFLFDTNNFDVPDVPEVDPDAPPPPPVFTLEELGMTREEGFNQGRLAGLEEAAASREQYIATQLERLAHDFKGVLLAEKMRENTYETEVLSLCEAIFARAFPALNRIHGMSEVLQIIRNVVVTQQEQSKLVIDIPQSELDEIRAQLEKLPEYDSAKVDLRETPDLHRGSCRIAWQNGGALRDHAALAELIAAEIAGESKHSLAPPPQKDDNSTAPAAPSGEE